MITDLASDDPSALADWLETTEPGISLLSFRSQFILRDVISEVRATLQNSQIYTVDYYPADPEATVGSAIALVAKCRKISTSEANAAIILCPLSGRIESKEKENTVTFWKNLNFQRETLGSLPARIVLCIDGTQKHYAYDYAKDLLSWCAPRFNFPTLPNAYSREEITNSILPAESQGDTAAAKLTIQSLSAKWELVITSGESLTQEQMRHLFFPLLGAALEMRDPSLAGTLLREANQRKPLSTSEEQEATWLDASGSVALLEGDFKAAEKFLMDALAIWESLAAHNPAATKILAGLSSSLNDLALLLQDTNRLDEAEPHLRRALAIDEASFGENHPNVATDLNNLAQLLQDTNRLDEAEPLMRRALQIDEASFGENHLNVARDFNNLALLLSETNRLEEAELLMRRALEIAETSLGESHPNVATHLNNLAQLLQASYRLDEAEPLMRRALAIDKATFGENHPIVAVRLNNLARLLQATDRLDEAEPLMRRNLVIFIEFTRNTGHHHPHLQTAARNYMGLLDDMKIENPESSQKLASLGPEAGWELEKWVAKLQELLESE